MAEQNTSAADVKQALQDVIRGILKNIDVGLVFDTHFIIQRILQVKSDAYIDFVALYAGGSQPTETAHQQIGHQINAIAEEPTLVERMKDPDGKKLQSCSFNIRLSMSDCALWRRIK